MSIRNGETRTFTKDLWALRTIFQKGIYDQEADEQINIWFWFFGKAGIDRWYAYGLSDEVNEDIAENILQGADLGAVHVLIDYIGEPWSLIAPAPAPHAQQMRDMANVLPEELIERLRSMTAQEILDLRADEERDAENRMGLN